MPDALDYSRKFSSEVIDNVAEDDIFTLTTGVLQNLVICICNQTASPVTLTGWVIPSGGSSGSDNRFMYNYSIAANDSVLIPVPRMITGDKLTLQAGTGSALTVFDASGVTRV